MSPFNIALGVMAEAATRNELGFVHAFGVVAVCIIAIGIYQRELRPIVGGAAYLLVAYVALYGYGRRSHA